MYQELTVQPQVNMGSGWVELSCDPGPTVLREELGMGTVRWPWETLWNTLF